MRNKNENNVPLDFWVVKVDETDSFNTRFLAKYPAIKKIYGAYLVDLGTRTYCCELTPSYELEHYEFQWDGDDVSEEEAEKINDELLSVGGYENNHYMHCSIVNNAEVFEFGFPKSRVGKTSYDQHSLEEDEDRDEVFEDYLQHLQANPI